MGAGLTIGGSRTVYTSPLASPTMDQGLPVKPIDLLVLAVVSVVGGIAIASWVMEPRPTPNFVVTISSGTVMLLFFLFIPVMGVRLFIEERRERTEQSEES